MEYQPANFEIFPQNSQKKLAQKKVTFWKITKLAAKPIAHWIGDKAARDFLLMVSHLVVIFDKSLHFLVPND
jgi:hypothetical protein